MGLFRKSIKHTKPSKDLDNKIKHLEEELKQTGVVSNDDSSSFCVKEEIDENTLPSIGEVKVAKEDSYNWRIGLYEESEVGEEDLNEEYISEIREKHRKLALVEDSIESIKIREAQSIFRELYQDQVEQVVEKYVSSNSADIVTLREDLFLELNKKPNVDLIALEEKIDLLAIKYRRLSEGLLNDPSKNSDLLSQNPVTLEQLKNHYQLLVGRLQEQLATLGGGGEVRLEFLDDVDRTTAKQDGYVLQYQSSTGKFIGTSYVSGSSGAQGVQGIQGPSGGVQGIQGIQGPSGGGLVGTAGTWGVDTVGINTVKNVGIGTTAKDGYKLYVEGDVRVTGIVTIGSSSITLDGDNNEIQVGTGVTLYGNTGIISATAFYAGGEQVTGAQGTQGIAGAGTQGVQGANGSDGAQGATGAGTQGITGAQGASGTQGTDGTQGATGAGTQGASGAQGTDGSQGTDGTQGATGAGTQGATGAQGASGTNGTNGSDGAQGATGVQGASGTNGTNGSDGAQGATGAQGASGTNGSDGAQGATGAQGASGAQGTDGTQGATGTGTQGATGAQGIDGTQGAIGAGTQGAQGTDGIQGPAGGEAGAIVGIDTVGTSLFNQLSISGVSTFSADLHVGTGVTIYANSGIVSATGFYVNGTELVGAQGATGAQGTEGAQGITGTQGTDGTQGATGTGTQGTTGAQGTTGTGTQGTTGAQGTDGTQGATGTGTQGTTGAQGTDGTQGTSGTNGTQGTTGAQGTDGTQGTSGTNGTQGTTGAQGTDGTQGAGGTQGATGAQGTTGTGTQGTTGAQGTDGAQGTQGITGPVAGSAFQVVFKSGNNEPTGSSNLTFENGVLSTSALSVSGNATILGDLTYENVTNVDSVGIATARSGLRVTGGGLDVVGVSTLKDDVNFNGTQVGVTSAYWDSSANKLNFKDFSKLTIGTHDDIEIYHEYPDTNVIDCISTLDVKSRFGIDFYNRLTGASWAKFDSSAVELYNNDEKKFETIGAGVTVTGTAFSNQLNVSGVSTFNGASTFNQDVTVGSGITFNAIAGSIDVKYLDVQRYGVVSGLSEHTSRVGIASVVDQWDTSESGLDFYTAEYTVHVGYGTYIQSQKVLVMQNGEYAYAQEYGVMYQPDIVVSFGATFSGNYVQLIATPESGVTGLTTYRFVRGSLL
jgi:hypothetical protein